MIAVLFAKAAASAAPGLPSRRRGELSFAGQALVEYQARQASRAGADRILIMVDDASPALTQVVDRLGQDAIHATLVRDMPALARHTGGQADILLIGDGYIVPLASLLALAQHAGPQMLVLPSNPATAQFERIDGQTAWAGAARVPAVQFHSVLDMLGDWDLALTIVRDLVQAGAGRVPCDSTDVLDGNLLIVTDAATAEAATQLLVRTGGANRATVRDVDAWPVGLPARTMAPIAARYEMSAVNVRLAAIAVGLLALVLILGRIEPLGLLLAYFALVGDRLASELTHIFQMDNDRSLLRYAVRGIATACVGLAGAMVGWQDPLALAGALAGAGLLVLIPLAARRQEPAAPPAAICYAPGAALLMMFCGFSVGLGLYASAANLLLSLGSISAILFLGDGRKPSSSVTQA